MDPIALLIKAGISKGVTKFVLHAAGVDTVSEAVATEIAGALAKRKSDETLSRLVARYIEAIAQHPEYRNIPQNDLNAVTLEVRDSFTLAVDPELFAQCGFNPSRIVSTIYDMRGHRGNPLGFSERSVAL